MTQSTKNEIYKIINTTLLSLIAIFGVYSMVILSTIKKDVNDIKINQAVMERDVNELERRVLHLENGKDQPTYRMRGSRLSDNKVNDNAENQ